MTVFELIYRVFKYEANKGALRKSASLFGSDYARAESIKLLIDYLDNELWRCRLNHRDTGDAINQDIKFTDFEVYVTSGSNIQRVERGRLAIAIPDRHFAKLSLSQQLLQSWFYELPLPDSWQADFTRKQTVWERFVQNMQTYSRVYREDPFAPGPYRGALGVMRSVHCDVLEARLNQLELESPAAAVQVEADRAAPAEVCVPEAPAQGAEEPQTRATRVDLRQYRIDKASLPLSLRLTFLENDIKRAERRAADRAAALDAMIDRACDRVFG